jgi:hypothetical protein
MRFHEGRTLPSCHQGGPLAVGRQGTSSALTVGLWRRRLRRLGTGDLVRLEIAAALGRASRAPRHSDWRSALVQAARCSRWRRRENRDLFTSETFDLAIRACREAHVGRTQTSAPGKQQLPTALVALTEFTALAARPSHPGIIRACVGTHDIHSVPNGRTGVVPAVRLRSAGGLPSRGCRRTSRKADTTRTRTRRSRRS